MRRLMTDGDEGVMQYTNTESVVLSASSEPFAEEWQSSLLSQTLLDDLVESALGWFLEGMSETLEDLCFSREPRRGVT